MNVELTATGVEVRLSHLETIMSLRRGLSIPFSNIETVDPRPGVRPRWKTLGTAVGSLLFGTFRTPEGVGFFATRNPEKRVALYLRTGEPRVVVVDVCDRDEFTLDLLNILKGQ